MKTNRFYAALFFLLSAVSLYAEIPAGYYHNANNKSGAELLDALNVICSPGVFLDYGSGRGSTWEGFFHTDRRSDGSVIDMYSSSSYRQTSFDAVDGLHIEHSLPKSWWGGMENYAYCDLHHLFPADAKTNITKNNLPLGETSSPTFANGVSKVGSNDYLGASGNCFEPADEYKGDFARAYFYIATTYNEFSALWQSPMMDNNTYPVWNAWALSLLLEWHRADPVSEKELTRQEAVFGIQHNRNPFVDYPQFVEHIWGDAKSLPVSLPADSRPFLTTVDKWSSVSIPAAMTGITVTRTVDLAGENFSDNLRVSLKRKSPSITLSATSVSPGQLRDTAHISISFSAAEPMSVADTLALVSAGFDTLLIPLDVNFIDRFMLTSAQAVSPTQAFVAWMPMPDVAEYPVSLYEGYRSQASDLFFSAYYEGDSFDKAVAVYNATGSEVDLADYSIRKQSNGTGAFSAQVQLDGIVPDGSVFVLVHSRASKPLADIADKMLSGNENNPLSFNGNDAIALYHNNILVDMIGEADNSAIWGENTAFARNADIYAPLVQFDKSQWHTIPVSAPEAIAAHTVSGIVPDNSPAVFTSQSDTLTLQNLRPSSLYTVEVSAGSSPSANAISFYTPALQTPEAYEPVGITDTECTARWESVPYATGYIIQLYAVEGSEHATVTEGFDHIGSSGKPQLPEGWSGTASGIYATISSSGASAPAVSLQNNLEWIQSPAAPSPLAAAQFMYRFPSTSASESYMLVYAVDSKGVHTKFDSIAYANTKKHTRSYTSEQLAASAYAIKIEYHKVKGNLAVDDFSYTYGMETIAPADAFYTTGPSEYRIGHLTANTTYLYTITAATQYNTPQESQSPVSNTIRFSTTDTSIGTSVPAAAASVPFITTSGREITVNNIAAFSEITVVSMHGTVVSTHSVSDLPTFTTQLPAPGVYIVRITGSAQSVTLKTIVF